MSSAPVNRAYLVLGSNIDAESNLPAAVAKLAEHGRVCGASAVWETAPLGFADQPNFLNAAVLLATPLSAIELQEAIGDIEQSLGRVRDPQNKNAPRTIDVDVALLNRDVLQIEHRRIPDPDILERAFVATVLAELDPDYVHPETGQTLAQIAGSFPPAPSTMLLRPDVILLDAVT